MPWTSQYLAALIGLILSLMRGGVSIEGVTDHISGDRCRSDRPASLNKGRGGSLVGEAHEPMGRSLQRALLGELGLEAAACRLTEPPTQLMITGQAA
jgi:hypothetical protein